MLRPHGGNETSIATEGMTTKKDQGSGQSRRKILEVFAGRRRRADDTTSGKLTDREFEVFQLVGQGLTTSEIGARLRLGAKTVQRPCAFHCPALVFG